MNDHSLVEILSERAALLEGVEAFASAEAIEWRLDGVAFGSCSGSCAEFRLRRKVAEAAIGTPDVAPSERGPGWVAFAPTTVDGFAADRAQAWLQSAWRYADERSAGAG
jgi:hypothetical protein